jgi:endonuclease/exonuclease/phosphatase family metal-dependent hydrolase
MPPSLEPICSPDCLRVVSANLRNGSVDPVWLRELVQALQADAVALQEADPPHFEALSSELPHGHFEPGKDHTGMGIALRGPAEMSLLPLAWRNAYQARLDPGGWPKLKRPLTILNLHIAAPHVYLPPLYGFILRGRQVRQLEAHFEAAFDSSHGTLVLGDFNATPLWPVYRRIARHFSDAAIAVAQRLGRPVEPTWGLPNGRRLLRIDHAFTRGVEPSEFQVVALPNSDHSAIVVDLVG